MPLIYHLSNRHDAIWKTQISRRLQPFLTWRFEKSPKRCILYFIQREACLHRLVVRTSGFHPGNMGSTPVGDANITAWPLRFQRPFLSILAWQVCRTMLLLYIAICYLSLNNQNTGKHQ